MYQLMAYRFIRGIFKLLINQSCKTSRPNSVKFTNSAQIDSAWAVLNGL